MIGSSFATACRGDGDFGLLLGCPIGSPFGVSNHREQTPPNQASTRFAGRDSLSFLLIVLSIAVPATGVGW